MEIGANSPDTRKPRWPAGQTAGRSGWADAALGLRRQPRSAVARCRLAPKGIVAVRAGRDDKFGEFVVDPRRACDSVMQADRVFWPVNDSPAVESVCDPERRTSSRRSQSDGGAAMASAWQRAIATAKLFLTVASAASACEHEASEYVRNVLSYQERQQLEQRLRRERDVDAALWVSRNS